ncbi:peptidylprolyl isomerase [Veillonella intestinalis]|uniref:peptidylprolyl isomerase n=1 Tax=Veillonella intestinalis TaxID=2941341 RepID=UPI00280B5918|nr:peptidylprolyl isomerase [Veillonella intestinalis]
MKLIKQYGNWRRLCTAGLLGVALLVTSACGAAQTDNTDAAKQGNTATAQVKTLQAPNLDNTPVKDHYAVFETSEGTFKVRLFGTKTPITVKNFDYLVNQGYYKDLTFHRVIDDFMIQGGDDGKGGPGYTIPDEFVNDLHFNRMGLLAMANRGPDTGGAQFFITLGPTPWLDNKHTIFGMVTQGMDVVAKIGKVATDKKDKPIEPVVIKSITLEPITDTQGSAK